VASRPTPKRERLPIDDALTGVLRQLAEGPCLVVQAAPGSGKTTRVPPALLDAPWCRGEVLVLEPRRLAAKLAARRVADEMGEPVGETVGYQFRFENVSGPRTRLRFLTEGMLMRRLLSDPALEGVSAVLLDEFHERHLHGDVAIAFLRRLQLGARPDLRLCAMSATLDAAAVARFLGDCPVVDVPTRRFDVAVEHAREAVGPRELDTAVRDAVVDSLRAKDSGDVLVFLPGMADIRRAAEALARAAARDGFDVLPLHGELSREEQDRAVGPARGRRKVILSTNVAETSLTIPGVSMVIDSGLARVASYSHWSGLPALRTRPISRASAIQRAGRAGRTGPGRCYRLYSKGDFDGRAPFEVPEISRADLTQTVLELAALGAGDPAGFPWFERPAPAALQSALGLLFRLGALDGQGRITPSGRRMVELPVHPRLARLALEAERQGFVADGVRLAAAIGEGRLEGVDLLAQFGRLGRDDGIARLEDRLTWALKRTGGSSAPGPRGRKREEALRFAVLCGFPDRVARRRALASNVNRGRASSELVFSAGGAAPFEEATAFPGAEYFVAVDAEEKRHHGQARSQLAVRMVSTIEPEWLFDLEPAGVAEREELVWNAERERVEAVERIAYDQLVLDETRGPPRDLEAAARLLVASLGDLGRICDPERLAALRARAAFLRESLGEAACPAFDDAYLRERLAAQAQGMVAAAEVRELDLLASILGKLPADAARRLERDAPETVTLARGRRVKVHYESGKPPWIESRLQDFFGMRQGPSVLGGRVSLTLHLLAPNQRAVQVTSDLAGFWARVYPDLRRELGRRYPRHSWPEDPLSA
jgi:ATP-dependent helicase HrpB